MIYLRGKNVLMGKSEQIITSDKTTY
jgi:hypothetical protein